jgi:DNA adenine methylase
VRPFLVCLDAKGAFVPELMSRMPTAYDTYHEPFFGSGALFFALQPDKARLADGNRELVMMYRTVRDKPRDVARELHKHINSETYYYVLRDLSLKDMTYIQRAARYLYLNRTSVLGHYYVNNPGKMIVPYGDNEHAKFASEKELECAASSLGKKGVTFAWGSFELTKEHAKKDDFVYFDPPHLPSKHPIEKGRAQGGFGFENYLTLEREMDVLDKRGCFVLLTCMDRPEIHELFKGFLIDSVPIKKVRMVEGERVYVECFELVIRNYP